MTLAHQASAAIVLPPAVTLACHSAVWFWAAREAQGLSPAGLKSVIATLGNITGINPEAAMLALMPSGNWDLNAPVMPPPGSVLVWSRGSPTHSAVFTANGRVTGYNQGCLRATLANTGYTSLLPTEIDPGKRMCEIVAEATIVRRAAAFDI